MIFAIQFRKENQHEQEACQNSNRDRRDCGRVLGRQRDRQQREYHRTLEKHPWRLIF